eukprot:gene35934-48338_t
MTRDNRCCDAASSALWRPVIAVAVNRRVGLEIGCGAHRQRRFGARASGGIVPNPMFDRIRASVPSPDKPFLTGSSGQLSYGGLLDRSAAFAGALQGLGVGPGDRVAVQTEKVVDAIALYLACLRCGAVLLPLNPAYTLTELQYFCED